MITQLLSVSSTFCNFYTINYSFFTFTEFTNALFFNKSSDCHCFTNNQVAYIRILVPEELNQVLFTFYTGYQMNIVFCNILDIFNKQFETTTFTSGANILTYIAKIVIKLIHVVTLFLNAETIGQARQYTNTIIVYFIAVDNFTNTVLKPINITSEFFHNNDTVKIIFKLLSSLTMFISDFYLGSIRIVIQHTRNSSFVIQNFLFIFMVIIPVTTFDKALSFVNSNCQCQNFHNFETFFHECLSQQLI